MNKKADEVLVTLLRAKEKIVLYSKEKVKNPDWQPYYNGLAENMDSIIVDYTISTKMSGDEIMDCYFEVGADNKKSIYYDDYMTMKMNL